MAVGKRARGWLLRLVLRRPMAISLGLAFIIPAVVLLVRDFPWETPATDGLGLIFGATGTALLLFGVGGRRPDWIDPA